MGAADSAYIESCQPYASFERRRFPCGFLHTLALLRAGMFIPQHSTKLDIKDIWFFKRVCEVLEDKGL